jgi:hypothetical protein
MSEDNKLSRRDWFKRSGVVGLAVLGSGAALTACDSGNGGGDKLTCTDTSGLKQSAIQTRKSLKYTDKSPKEGKTCANCNFYEPPKQQGKCGSCTVVKGPIHPDGYCTSWAKKQG